MLHPSEVRIRREIVQTAIRRLLATPTPRSRQELFASTSRQSALPVWQRQLLGELIRRGLVVRSGTTRARYTVAIDQNSNADKELSAIAKDPKAVDALLAAATVIRSSDPGTDLAAGYEGAVTDTSEPVAAAIEEDISFKLLYGIAEATAYIRERVATFDQRLARLEQAWFGPDPDPDPDADQQNLGDR